MFHVEVHYSSLADFEGYTSAGFNIHGSPVTDLWVVQNQPQVEIEGECLLEPGLHNVGYEGYTPLLVRQQAAECFGFAAAQQ